MSLQGAQATRQSSPNCHLAYALPQPNLIASHKVAWQSSGTVTLPRNTSPHTTRGTQPVSKNTSLAETSPPHIRTFRLPPVIASHKVARQSSGTVIVLGRLPTFPLDCHVGSQRDPPRNDIRISGIEAPPDPTCKLQEAPREGFLIPACELLQLLRDARVRPKWHPPPLRVRRENRSGLRACTVP